MKESERYDQMSHMTIEHMPNALGFKWKFFRFCTIFKNISLRRTTFSAFATFIQLAIPTLVCIYPLVGETKQNTPGAPIIDYTFFPYSKQIQEFIPGSFSLLPYKVLAFLFVFFPLVVFIITFRNPDLLLHLHYFLSPQIITIYFPYVCAAYSCSIMLYFSHQLSTLDRIFTFLNNILFFLFLFLYIVLTYVDNNSIINPNNVTGEWFVGFTPLLPFSEFIIIFVSLQMQNMTEIYYYSALSAEFIISLITNVLCVIEMPLLRPTLNSLIASNYFTILTLIILGVIKVSFKLNFEYFYLMFIPFLFVPLFFLYRFYIEYKRSSIQPYLDQLDTDKDDYTVRAISTTLESLTTERQLRLLIYEGLTAGNQIITSKSFVQFCLERFPRSQWMASYISFLCLLYWDSNTIIYQFMLHTLSLDYFGMRNLHLFQAIFCLMQTSENLSPVIARELDEYRCEVAEFASLHRSFWKSVRNGNESSFHDLFFALHRKINSLAGHVKILSMKYPYCSSIQSENALFFADVKHNYFKSSEFYYRAAQLLNAKRSFIIDEMTSKFSQLFPIPKSDSNKSSHENDTKAIDELRFISNLEYHERALRYMTVVSSNDKYLQALSHAFSVPTNQQPVDIVFDKFRTIIIKVTFYLPIVFFIIFGLVIFGGNIKNDTDEEAYKESVLILESMNLFRNQIYFTRQDARLLANILLDSFNEIVNKSIYYDVSDNSWYDTMTILYVLSMEHTKAIEALFNQQFYIFSTRKVHQNVKFAIPGCDSTNCSLTFLYSDLHKIIKYMLNPKDPYRLTNTSLIQQLDNFSEKLMNLTDSTHEQLVESHYNWIVGTIDANTEFYTHLLLTILFVSSITLIIYVVTTMTLKKHVYAVIKTIQPAMLKSISFQFDKLISHEQKQTQTIQDHTFIKGILFFIASFTILIVYSILMLLAQRYYKNNIQPRMTYLRPFPEPDNFSEFIIFMVGILEGTARWGIDLDMINKGTRLLLEMSLLTPISCIYHLYFKTCYNCYAKTFYYDRFDSQSLWWLSYLALFLSLLCLIGFLYYTYQIIYIGKTVEDIMKFVPTSARKSNPVLQKFMAGDQIPIKEISEFARDIGVAPETPEFFAIIYLDPLENVIQTKGQISSFLPFIPNNLGEVQEYLIRNSTDSGVSISNFFKSKSPLESRSLSINGLELSFTFSRKGSILLIKDDSHHHTLNDRTRMIERLHSTVKEGKDRRKGMNLGQTVLLIIESKGKTTHFNIVKMLESICNVVDTRFRRIVCFSNLEKVTDIIKVTNEIFKDYGNEIKGVLHCGNSLSVLQSAVSIEKPRVFGQAYDEGKMMLSKAKLGELVQSDPFMALLV